MSSYCSVLEDTTFFLDNMNFQSPFCFRVFVWFSPLLTSVRCIILHLCWTPNCPSTTGLFTSGFYLSLLEWWWWLNCFSTVSCWYSWTLLIHSVQLVDIVCLKMVATLGTCSHSYQKKTTFADVGTGAGKVANFQGITLASILSSVWENSGKKQVAMCVRHEKHENAVVGTVDVLL